MCRVSDSCKLFSGIYHAVGDRTDAAGGSRGGIIGMERGRHGRAAGLRTHVLVSLGAAISAIVGLYTTEVLEYSNDPLRVGAQVISGIGFLGVGSILIVGKSHVRGLTTAAGLWATASIGLASGVGYLTVACAATLVVFLTMTVMSRLEASADLRQTTSVTILSFPISIWSMAWWKSCATATRRRMSASSRRAAR